VASFAPPSGHFWTHQRPLLRAYCTYAIDSKKLKWYMKIASIIMVLIFIAAIGAIGLLLPTIGSPWVNYFIYPALQLVLLGSILDIKTKKEKQN